MTTGGGGGGGGAVPILVMDKSSKKREPKDPFCPTCNAKNCIEAVPAGEVATTEVGCQMFKGALFVPQWVPSCVEMGLLLPSRNTICSNPNPVSPVLSNDSGSPDQFNTKPLSCQIELLVAAPPEII